jgi:3'-phosphoadenosine 5'-phosphosulfate sulfotransferase (PAPS reductase)/FAD synthetase
MKTINVCSVSGGKDSTALYCLMVEYHGKDFIPIFADTGHEHPVTVNYVRNLHNMANGPEVVIVKADFSKGIRMRRKSRIEKARQLIGTTEYTKALAFARKMKPSGNTFLDMMVWTNAIPSSERQFCTEFLKLWPIKYYLDKEYPSSKFHWVMHNGMRAQESRKRAKKQPFEVDTFFDALGVKPLFYETEETVFEILEKHGVPPNPLYAIGNSRVGCFPCIYANKDQLAALPDWAWEKLIWYEKVVGRSWFQGLKSISEVREWCKTSHGGKQYNMFRQAEDAPSCMTGWTACE